jgi:hypothetical protein
LNALMRFEALRKASTGSARTAGSSSKVPTQ